MRQILSIFEEYLKGEAELDYALNEVGEHIQQTSESGYLCVWRALKSLKHGHFKDLCSHLRQVIVYSRRGYAVSPELHSRLTAAQDEFGFTFYMHNGERMVSCRRQMLEGDPDLESVFVHEKRSVNKGSVGDGCLCRCLGYTHYISLAQKVLMYTINNMKANETLLACLPTGGGKSLAWQLPAAAAQYDGLTIVVVPIVALAHDHQHSTQAMQKRVGAKGARSAAYDGSTSCAEKHRILSQIREGKLSVLYISPEALLYKEFRECVLSAARDGKVSCLVIDEAHLVVNWGGHFRPEFQLLASFRNHLRAESPQGLRTILLSATYTSEETATLRTIFEDDEFTEFRADMLRPEFSFFHKRCQNQEERERAVLELAAQVPRPLIIYCFGPSDAEIYFRLLRSAGYRNIAMYTGDTSTQERQRIMEDWKEDNIDIMVATSAFGMGVDKADVRTIIHTYIPETVSRYYQEAGRAGRDGYSALCYWLTVEEVDREGVQSLTRSAILTVDKIVERWTALLRDISKRESGSRVWVNVNVPPDRLQYQFTGKRNAGWNKDVVLFLFRLGLIDILDADIVSARAYEILIQLKDPGLLENPERLATYLDEYRQRERKRITDHSRQVRRLMQAGRRECYGTLLTETFELASPACSGCPGCRARGRGPYQGDFSVAITSTKQGLHEAGKIARNVITKYLQVDSELVLTVDGCLSGRKLKKCLRFLAGSGANIIAVPEVADQEEVLDELACIDAGGYMLLDYGELDEIGIKWLNGTCALVYSGEADLDEWIYRFSKRYLKADVNNSVIHVTRSDHFVECENKRLSQVVNGFMIEGERLFAEEVQHEDRKYAT